MLIVAGLVCGLLSVADAASAAIAPRATVAKVSRASGPVSGRTRVTIRGSGFRHVQAVRFGSARATGVRVLSSTRLAATVPAHAPGVVAVHVVTPAGTSHTKAAARYRYVVPSCAALPYQRYGAHLWTDFHNTSSALAVNIARLICSAADGATIDLKTWYMLPPSGVASNRIAAALALMHRYHRVRVNILVGRNFWPQSHLSWSAFTRAYPYAHIYYCYYACRGPGTAAISHDKWILVSRLKAAQGGGSAVLTTSTNFSEQQFTSAESGLLMVRQDAISRAFAARWSSYVACAEHRACNRSVTPATWTRSSTESVYFSPASDDPIAADLATVDCTHHGTISVISLLLSRPAFVRQLTRLRQTGCTVNAIVEHKPSAAVVAALHPKGEFNHDKLVIVDVPGKHVVYAGSENFTGPSIHANDNVMVRSTSESVLSGYRSYFATNWAWSKSRHW